MNDTDDRTGKWRGGAVVAVIFAASAFYLSTLPYNLNPADESVHLYQAKRLLEGEVMYRDIWNTITPGWMYLMALLFGVFGTDMATARVTAAVLHALTAVLIFLSCRRLRIRPSLSWPPALVYIVVCHPAWPIASQHWLATTLSAATLFVLAGRKRASASWPFLPGFVAGLITAVSQPRGLSIAFGLFLWLILDEVIQRRFNSHTGRPPLVSQLSALVGGGLAVGVPLCIWMIAEAGFDAVWQALVAYPINNYGANTKCPWGYSGIMTVRLAAYTFPTVLKYLPLILLVSAARLLFLWLRRIRPDEASRLTLLICFCLSSALSISYFPDFIHIAFIAAAFFITIAESCEWALQHIAPQPRRALRNLGWIGAAAILAASAQRLSSNAERLRTSNPISRTTSFGRVDFAHEPQAQIYDRLEQLLRSAPSRSLYCYPPLSGLYLMLDVDDPTPYGFLVPGFSPAEYVSDALQHLDANPPYYVASMARWIPVRADDPIAAWIREHYEPIGGTGTIDEMILRRKNETNGDPAL
jgi:hypothetical protein